MKKNDTRLEYNVIKDNTFKLWLDPDEIKDWEKHGWECVQNSGQMNMFNN